MSKFCMQCGQQIDDDANVCQYCGSFQNEDNTLNSVAKASKKTFPVLVAVAAVIIVVLFMLFKIFFGGSFKDPINDFCKAMETGKGKYLYKAVPTFMLENEYNETKKSKLIDKLDEGCETINDVLEDEYGDDLKITYKVKKKEKIDKDDLEDMEDDIEDDYDEKVNVSKGYKVKIRMTLKGDDDSDNNTFTINVYKIDGNWYITPDSLSYSFNSLF